MELTAMLAPADSSTMLSGFGVSLRGAGLPVLRAHAVNVRGDARNGCLAAQSALLCLLLCVCCLKRHGEWWSRDGGRGRDEGQGFAVGR